MHPLCGPKLLWVTLFGQLTNLNQHLFENLRESLLVTKPVSISSRSSSHSSVHCTAPVLGATQFATFPIGFPQLPTSSPASILLPLTLLPHLLPQDSNLFPFCLIPMTRLPYMPSNLPHAFPTIPPSASNPPHLGG